MPISIFCSHHASQLIDRPAALKRTIPRYHTWGDIERASARVANLLGSLNLLSGARIAVQVKNRLET